jgi:hypothetical protein
MKTTVTFQVQYWRGCDFFLLSCLILLSEDHSPMRVIINSFIIRHPFAASYIKRPLCDALSLKLKKNVCCYIVFFYKMN